jgi:uncharacterized protein
VFAASEDWGNDGALEGGLAGRIDRAASESLRTGRHPEDRRYGAPSRRTDLVRAAPRRELTSRDHTMTIIVRDDPVGHRYELLVDDQVAGFADYQLGDGRISFRHTEVDGAYAGQGLGNELVAGMLADVEERGLEVVPLCPFVREVIARDSSNYLHLVPDDVRPSLGLADPSA